MEYEYEYEYDYKVWVHQGSEFYYNTHLLKG